MSWCRLETYVILCHPCHPYMIYVCNIFNCMVSFKCRCQGASQYLWSSTFVMKLSKKNYHNSTEVALINLFSLTVVSKQKNKNKNTKYHGTFISFKSHLCSKQGSPIFLLFGWWSIVSLCLGLVKVFLITLSW